MIILQTIFALMVGVAIIAILLIVLICGIYGGIEYMLNDMLSPLERIGGALTAILDIGFLGLGILFIIELI